MNNYKNIMAALFLFASVIFYGQDKHNGDKIKALKVAFITERLDLSSKEAQAFWPMYNTYEEDREALREKEASVLLRQYIDYEEEEERLDTAFYQQVAKVISAKKALLLLRSEEEFKRQLIKQYRQKHGGRTP